MKLSITLLIMMPFIAIDNYAFSMYPATPPSPINSPAIKEKKSICAIMPWLCLKTKIKKLLQKRYLIINTADQTDYTLDEVHDELIRMLPEKEIYPKEEAQKNITITPIERQILHLAKENKLKTVTFVNGIDIEQVVVSSSSSSESSTPNNSPVGSLESSDNDLFTMEK